MNSLSSRSIVDQMASQLAERRRTSIGRRAAYIALAQAILMDEPQQLSNLPVLERQPTSIGQAAFAA
jgi:hypothetical protein